MRTYYLTYVVKPRSYPRNSVQVGLTADSKKAFPRYAPKSFPGRTVGEALEKLERWSSKMLTEQTQVTSRAVLTEAGA